MIKVAVVDNERHAREWLESYAKGEARDIMTVIGADVTVSGLIANATEVPDVAVLDVFLDDDTHLAGNIRRLRAWGANVVIFSRNDRSPELRRTAMEEGALGFLHKDEGLPAMRAAIEHAAAGDVYMTPELGAFLLMAKVGLSPKQEEAAAFIAAGMSNAEIAKAMYISEDVVKEHVRKIKEKYLKAGRPAPSRHELMERLSEDDY